MLRLLASISISSIIIAFSNAEVTTVDNLPPFNTGNQIDFYYCETSFPYTAPVDIIAAAGASFSSYSTAVAGLGIWDVTSDVKITVQLVSSNYMGALLPTLKPLSSTTGYIEWNNSGIVVVTNPMSSGAWSNSRHIASASGVAYLDLVNYLKDNQDLFPYYQPISVIQPTPEVLSPTSSAFNGNTDSQGLGNIIIPAQNSYAFLNNLMNQLADFGVDLSTFLTTYQNTFAYIAKNGTTVETVSWEPDGPADPAVYKWFQQLEQCYKVQFNDAVSNKGGAQYFLEAVQSCYGSTAYVFQSPNSVYKVTLMNFSSYATPVLYRTVYDIPDTPSNQNQPLFVMDYIIICIALLALLYSVYFITNMITSKSQRRRVSFEGERIAAKAVAGSQETDENAIHNYYTSRETYSQSNFDSSRHSTLNSILAFGGRNITGDTSSSSNSDLRTQLAPSNSSIS